MAIDALRIITASTKPTWGLSGDESQSSQLIIAWSIGMNVFAFITIRAIVPEEVNVAHFDFLNTLHFAFVILH